MKESKFTLFDLYAAHPDRRDDLDALVSEVRAAALTDAAERLRSNQGTVWDDYTAGFEAGHQSAAEALEAYAAEETS